MQFSWLWDFLFFSLHRNFSLKGVHQIDCWTSFLQFWYRAGSIAIGIRFCNIDLKTVLHETFNWTVAVNYNKETKSLDRNRETSETLSDEF